MPITDGEWSETIRALHTQCAKVSSWPPTAPNPAAQRCRECRHRTLAHLRAAQEIWLQVARHIAGQSPKGIRSLHPWTVFTNENYAQRSWHEHRDKFLKDRQEWIKLVHNPLADRTLSTQFNGKLITLEQLTQKLVIHEAHHLQDFDD